MREAILAVDAEREIAVKSKAELDNHSTNFDPKNPQYYKSRGIPVPAEIAADEQSSAPAKSAPLVAKK